VSYLEFYVCYLKAIEHFVDLNDADQPPVKIAFVIMTLGDTDAVTRLLLEEHDYFGADRDQLPLSCRTRSPPCVTILPASC
jgi:hypothetical protein